VAFADADFIDGDLLQFLELGKRKTSEQVSFFMLDGRLFFRVISP
jgi:hypothetical protein